MSGNARKDEGVMGGMKKVLVTAIVNRGFSSEVMAAAREAGAMGAPSFIAVRV